MHLSFLRAAHVGAGVISVVFSLGFSATTAAAQNYPLTLTDKYGTATIEKKPERIVSLSYSGHDDILALGVKPVALRYWYGNYPYGVFPWAQEALGDAKPVMLKGDLNIEQIAALKPDVIMGIVSGITKDQYDLLSQIAPTVAPQAQYGDWGTPWQVAARTRGEVLGKLDEANTRIKALEDRIKSIREAHPEWQGKTAAIGFYWNDAPGAYTSTDIRAQLLHQLGFVTPKAIDNAADKGAFYVSLSNEDISALDADVLIWFGTFDEINKVKLRDTLKVHKDGGEIVAPELLADAFSHSSLLSLNYVLDHLVPLLEKATGET